MLCMTAAIGAFRAPRALASLLNVPRSTHPRNASPIAEQAKPFLSHVRASLAGSTDATSENSSFAMCRLCVCEYSHQRRVFQIFGLHLREKHD